MKRSLLWIGLCVVTGCAAPPQPGAPPPASNPPAAAQPSVNLSGYPPDFRQGYADGCASVGGKQVRNEARFKSEPNYAQGWRDGYEICARRK